MKKLKASIFILVILEAFALPLAPSMNAQAPSGGPFTYSRLFAAEAFRYKNTCVSLMGSFSDDFLRDLKAKRNHAGVQFEKKGIAITTFPADIGVLLVSSVSKCPARHMDVIPELQNVTIDELHTLQLRVHWLGVSPDHDNKVPSESVRPEWAAPNIWYFSVPSHKIPLTATIEIEVLTAKGTLVTTLKGSLADSV